MYQSTNFGFKSPRVFKSGNSTPNGSAKGFRRKHSILKLAKFQQNQEYNPHGSKDFKSSVYYDSSTAVKDSSFQKSIRTNQSQQSNEYSSKKSFRSSQYSLTGFHVERKKMQHQIMLGKKQNQRLKKQIQQKDKQISQSEQNRTKFKQIESELIETYRVINYYEGKIKQQEKIIQYHQKIVDQQVEKHSKGRLKEGMDFKQIIEFFRNQSIELKGELEKSNYENTKTILKLNKLEIKYNNLHKSYNQASKRQKNVMNQYESTNLHNNMPQNQKITTIYQTKLQNSLNRIGHRRGDDQASVTSSVRSGSSKGAFMRPSNNLSIKSIDQPQSQKLQISKMYGNFNSKINKIQKQLDFFKIQNQKIQNELNQKIIEIGKLRRQNDELKYLLEDHGDTDVRMSQAFKTVNSNGNQQTDSLNRVTILPRDVLGVKKHQIPSSRHLSNFITVKNSNSNNNLSTKQMPSQRSIEGKSKNELKNLSLNQITKKIHQSHTKGYKFKQISEETIRKLRYNLIRQDITYSKLVQRISQKLVMSNNSNGIIQVLQDIPLQLTSKQSSAFIFQYKKIQTYLKEQDMINSKNKSNEPNKDLSQQDQTKILREKVIHIFKDNIPIFKNITLRRDASLTSQLTKTFKNRLAELQPYLRDKKKGLIQFADAQRLLRQQWNLSEQEIDFIFLKSSESSQQHSIFDFYKTINFFLQN